MSLILFLIFGLMVGLLARALMPGRQNMGVLMTVLLGTLGSFLGGLLASLFSDSEPMRIHAAGLIGSVIGAMVILSFASIMYRSRSYP
ncbi:MAG TPA: GlsB/YeaQ/YmgE family stress response membrane protein [Polyangiaceae bacterium]|nr:GlsB/YeaQ/YmgE family stress response membrane protein [Polyangiaceae bacterium]